MDATSGGLIAALAWTSLYVSVSAVAAGVLLRILRVSSPRLHRLAWACVILQAWFVYPYTIPIQVDSASLTAQTDSAAEPSLADKLQAERTVPAITAAVVEESTRSTERSMPNVAPAVDESRVPQTWRDWLAVVWLAGVAVPVAWYLVHYARFVRAVPFGTPPERREWLQEWAEACKERRIRRKAELRMTQSLGPLLCYVPFVYRVLVPRRLWVQLDRGDRLAILRHELAHLARGDLWKSAAVRILALPQWFNPLIWWAVRRFDEAGEWACDDLAKGRDAGQHVGYAKTLVRLGELVTQTPAGAACVRGGCLTKRVHRLVHTCFTEDSVMKKGLVYVFLLGLTVAHGLRVEVIAEEGQTSAHAREKPSSVADAGSDTLVAETPLKVPIYQVVYDVHDLIRPNEVNASFESLIEDIQSEVAPETWDRDRVRIADYRENLSLVVSQNEVAHEQLSDWLAARRRSRDLERTGLMPYRIEPPDVLQIDAGKLSPKATYLLGIGDAITVRVDGYLKNRLVVQLDGAVDLGPYGKVEVTGLSLRQAEVAIDEYLRKFLKDPKVSISFSDSFAIQAVTLVRPGGSVDLGLYGSVHVAGMTVRDAEAAIERHLARKFHDPDVTVDVWAYNSKVYYVITEEAAGRHHLLRMPITGNETVLDAIAAADSLRVPKKVEIYVARSPADGRKVVENLPVDWNAITLNADLRTNYALLPGDRIFIRDKSINRDLVDLSQLELEIEEQREVLDELEAKRSARIEKLGPDAVEKIILGMGDPSRSPAEDSGDEKRTTEPSLVLYGPVVSPGEVAEATADMVRKALIHAQPDATDREVVVEKIASYVGEPRVFPIVGRAQLHNTRYRVRVPTAAEADGERRTLLVDYHQIVMLPAGD
jgi:polysaccharide biosynthesis/export protein